MASLDRQQSDSYRHQVVLNQFYEFFWAGLFLPHLKLVFADPASFANTIINGAKYYMNLYLNESNHRIPLEFEDLLDPRLIPKVFERNWFHFPFCQLNGTHDVGKTIVTKPKCVINTCSAHTSSSVCGPPSETPRITYVKMNRVRATRPALAYQERSSSSRLRWKN